MEEHTRKKCSSDVMCLREEIREAWRSKIKDVFIKELEKAEGDIDKIVDLASKLKDMAGESWKESVWRDGGGHWRQSWRDSADAITVDKCLVTSYPVGSLREIQMTIQDLIKKQTE